MSSRKGWTAEEDATLFVALVNQITNINYEALAALFEDRTVEGVKKHISQLKKRGTHNSGDAAKGADNDGEIPSRSGTSAAAPTSKGKATNGAKGEKTGKGSTAAATKGKAKDSKVATAKNTKGNGKENGKVNSKENGKDHSKAVNNAKEDEDNENDAEEEASNADAEDTEVPNEDENHEDQEDNAAGEEDADDEQDKKAAEKKVAPKKGSVKANASVVKSAKGKGVTKINDAPNGNSEEVDTTADAGAGGSKDTVTTAGRGRGSGRGGRGSRGGRGGRGGGAAQGDDHKGSNNSTAIPATFTSVLATKRKRPDAGNGSTENDDTRSTTAGSDVGAGSKKSVNKKAKLDVLDEELLGNIPAKNHTAGTGGANTGNKKKPVVKVTKQKRVTKKAASAASVSQTEGNAADTDTEAGVLMGTIPEYEDEKEGAGEGTMGTTLQAEDYSDGIDEMVP